MTVSTSFSVSDSACNAATTAFPVAFQFANPSDLIVELIDNSTHVVTLLVEGTDYTRTGDGMAAPSGILTATAYPSGKTIRRRRETPQTQPLDMVPNVGAPAESQERAWDRAVLILQELAEKIGRSLRVPIGSTAPTVPALSGGEGKVFGVVNGAIVFVPNDNVAVAGAVAAAQAAATTALGAAEQTSADLASTLEALSLLPVRNNKTADTVVTATTTLAADPDLQVAIAANASVTIKGRIYFTTTDAADFKWRHTGPAAPGRVRVLRRTVAPAASVDSGILVDVAYSAADIVVSGVAGTGVIEIDATIKNGANAGHFGISWGPNASDSGNTIVEANSYLEVAVLATPLVVAFGDNSIAKLGEWPIVTYGGRTGTPGEQDISSWVEFIASGYKLTAVMYGNGNACTLTIDGVPQVLTPPAGWSTVTLFDALTDAPHRVKLSGAVGTSNACAFDVADTFSLSSHGTPSITRPSDISNYWFLGAAPYSTYGALDTTPVFGGGFGFYSHSYTWHGDGFEMRFRSATDKIQIFSYGYGTEQYVVLQDGIEVADVAIPADNIWDIRTLKTGLSGIHDYRIFQRVALSISTNLAVLAETIEHVAHPVLDLDVWYGDSIVVAGILTDIREFSGHIIATAGGRASRRLGNGGQRASTFGRDNTAQVTGLSQTPANVIELFGVNDMQGAVPLATFQADVQTELVNLRAGLAGVPIFCLGILPVDAGVSNAAQRSAYNLRKAAAVASIGDPLIFYVNTDGWLNPATDTYDGLHPNTAGYAKIATQLLAVM